MKVAPFLLRLMHYASLSPRMKLGPEDRIAIAFATRLRVATIEGRLLAVWCHVPNELAGSARATPAAAIARAAGLIAGAPDYLFLAEGAALALEAKSPTGALSPGQKDFAAWCAQLGVPCQVFRSADEGETILRDRGLLI